MEWLNALILGVIQGIAEFLPISSSAHLILYSSLVGGYTLPISLNIALHFGTLMAVLLFFWKDWIKMIIALKEAVFNGKKSFDSHVLFPALVLGTIPAAILGLLFEDKIEALFHKPSMVLLPLALVGVLLWYVDMKSKGKKTIHDVTVKDGVLVGLAQACALIPGTSRSGSTMICARMLGFSREDSAKFSFMLGTPIMLGATILKSKEIINSISEPSFYIGILTSFFVGCLCIKYLLQYLKTNSFLGFALYRVVLAIVIAISLS